jgi:hypothetical protein
MARIARIIGEVRVIRGPYLDKLSRRRPRTVLLPIAFHTGLREARKVLDFRRFLGIGELFLPALQADFEVFRGFFGNGMANSSRKTRFFGAIFCRFGFWSWVFGLGSWILSDWAFFCGRVGYWKYQWMGDSAGGPDT